MPSITTQLSRFVANTRFDGLEPAIVDYTKLVILDSVICGLAAANLERSRMMHRIVTELGGPAEASVFGMASRVPAAHAAMANAEIMNLLDADDTFFTSSHFAVFNVAAAIAEAQRSGGSGRDLITATAVGFDVNARLNLAQLVMGERADGSFEWSPVQGMGFAALGTAASAANLLHWDADAVANLLGLATWMAPTAVYNTMPERRQHLSFKYANYAGAAQAGMQALAFAGVGYVGDADALDTGGFLRAQGCVAIDQERLTEELGRKWWIAETCLKPWPSCRYTHGPIDMLGALMREEGLMAADIEQIDIRMNPMGYALKIFREPPQSIAADHRAPLNGAFNIPYVMALAALGHTPGPRWYSAELLDDPAVRELARRIRTVEDESARGEVVRAFRESPIRRFRKTPSAIVVHARGKVFERSSDYASGDPWSDRTRADWAFVERKFANFCGELLDAGERAAIVERIRHLEELNKVDTLF